MLQRSTIKFLADLSNNNSKEWMDEHRKQYEAAKADYEILVTELIKVLTPYEPAVANLQPKQCIFRLNRDIRFSADKSPYKSNFGAAFSREGKKYPGAGYYFHLQPGKSFIAGGIWMPDAPLLKKIRQEIDYNCEAFKKIVDAKSFVKTLGAMDGDRLKRAPQGYSEDNPAIEYLKFKSFTVNAPIDDKVLTTAELLKTSDKIFAEMKPFIDFLNTAV